jgi:uncharacterized protein (DUF433 family)
MGSECPKDCFREEKGSLSDYISATKCYMGGRPVLKGTRFPLAQFLAELAQGNVSVHDLAKSFDWDQDYIDLATGALNALATYVNENPKIFKENLDV